jgi:hypothetical protein
MLAFAVVALVVAVLVIGVGLGILVGRTLRSRDAQISREDDER